MSAIHNLPPGFTQVEENETSYRGSPMKEIKYEKELGKLDRVGKCVTGILYSLVSIPTTILTVGKGLNGIAFKDTIKDSFTEMYTGVEKKEVYQDSAVPIMRNAGYDPTDRDSLREYVDQHPNSLMVDPKSGHQYIINYENSEVILIPSGDENRKKICVIHFYNVQTGKDVKDKLDQAVRAYLVAHSKIEEQTKEIFSSLATQKQQVEEEIETLRQSFLHPTIPLHLKALVKMKKMTQQEAKDRVKDPIRQRMNDLEGIADNIQKVIDSGGYPCTDFVIDFDRQIVRVFSHPAHDENMGLFNGVRLDLDKDLWKTMTDFYDHNKTKGKEPLKGEKVEHPEHKSLLNMDNEIELNHKN